MLPVLPLGAADDIPAGFSVRFDCRDRGTLKARLRRPVIEVLARATATISSGDYRTQTKAHQIRRGSRFWSPLENK